MAKSRRCSFCGKSEDEGAVLVAGPGVFICDGCIKLADAVLEQELPQPHPEL